MALDVLCHLGRFHASPTAKHDTLFQVLVENLSLDVLAISANFACHADSDFILFQQFCYFGDKGDELQSGADIGLVLAQQILEAERRRLHEAHLRTADLRAAMEAAGLTPAAEGGIAEELLRRPEISYPLVAGIIGWGEEITPMLAERLETEIKYAGYIARQDRMIREVARHEKTLIPEDFEYAALTGLTLEAREKLARIRPRNLGQAGRIPGVSPSDVAQLSIALAGKQQK